MEKKIRTIELDGKTVKLQIVGLLPLSLTLLGRQRCRLDSSRLTSAWNDCSGIPPAKNGSAPSRRRTIAAPTASASSTMSPTWIPSTTSSNGCKKSIGTPPRGLTSSWSATRAIWRTRRLSSTQSQRYAASFPAPFAVGHAIWALDLAHCMRSGRLLPLPGDVNDVLGSWSIRA